MGTWENILLVIIGIIGIAMALMGIDFYSKYEKNKKLSKTGKNVLIGLLIVYIILLIGSLYYTGYKYIDTRREYHALRKLYSSPQPVSTQSVRRIS